VSTGEQEGKVEPGRVASRPVHDGRIVHLSVDTVRLPDGSQRELEFIHHAGASAVLPVVGRLDEPDPDVLLVHQYRYASGGWLYEVPAGMPSRPGEPWEEVARRELEEETGWRAGRLVPLTRIFTTPGFTDEVIHLFLATELEPGTVKLDEDEFVEVVRVPLSQALEWVRDGRIVDGKSVATLLFAAGFALGGR
jgi:ADP-ribose pyrophosphatase